MRLHEITDYNVNGVIIKKSNRTNTGFEGITFSVTWRPKAPFVATAKNDEELFSYTGTKSNSVHIGYFSDSREAAYVKSVFENSPIDEKINILSGNIDLTFPDDLYKLPEKITHKEAEEKIITYRKTKQVFKLTDAVVKQTLKHILDSNSLTVQKIGLPIIGEWVRSILKAKPQSEEDLSVLLNQYVNDYMTSEK